MVGDDLQECLAGNTFLTSFLCTEGEGFAWLLFYFLVQCKEMKICDFGPPPPLPPSLVLIESQKGGSVDFNRLCIKPKLSLLAFEPKKKEIRSIFFREEIDEPV